MITNGDMSLSGRCNAAYRDRGAHAFAKGSSSMERQRLNVLAHHIQPAKYEKTYFFLRHSAIFFLMSM